MRIKKIFIGLIIVTLSIGVGCSNSISNENEVIDSIVVDEDAKGTANSNNSFNVTKVLTTENLKGNKNKAVIRNNDELIEYSIDDGRTVYKTQFPKLYINSLGVGTITDKMENNRNIINWENKDIDGRLLVDNMGYGEYFKILKDNKVYMLDNNYELKELTAYKKLIEDTNGNLNKFQSSDNGKLDIYYFDEGKGIEKIVIIDTLNDEYYEISGKVFENIIYRELNIVMVEDNKIYISLPAMTSEGSSILGYIENNKLTTFFDNKSTIKVDVRGDVVYKNNNILFSGYVEDDYGIWNYNVEEKKLEKEADLKYDYSYFKINEDKNFIIITNTNSNEKFNISIARLNDNLKISNIQELTNSILPNISRENWSTIRGWSNEGNKFYVQYVHSKSIDGGLKVDDIYYEIYEVK